MLQLAYPIDNSIEIDGISYEMDMSFDNVLRLIDLVADNDLNDAEKVIIGIEMMIGVCFLHDINTQADIFTQIFKSTIGKEAEDNTPVDIDGNPMPIPGGENNKKTYSLKEDAEYIFASFYQDYGVDLIEQQGKLHWFKFKAMLDGLRSDTQFKEVINIRTMELPKGKGSSKQRENVKKLKKQYALKGDD